MRLSQEILQQLNCGVLLIDNERKILLCNQWLMTRGGLIDSEVLGRELSSLSEKFDSLRLSTALDNVIHFGLSSILSHSLHGNIFSLYNLQNKVVDHEVSLHPIQSGEEWHVLIQVNDISSSSRRDRSLRAIHQALEESSRVKDDFLASMSHELRTPLSSIIGNSEYILDQDHIPFNELKPMIRDIESAGRAQLALVNDILDMSKISSGKFTIDEAPYNLKGLLSEVERMLSVRARDEGNRLSVLERRAQQTYLMGDAQRIAQILINLLTNAIKFTQNGEISLVTWNDSSNLFFEVKDSGIGMSQETLDRLFKPFEQADSSISKRYGGTGLGLFISYGLAELMKGEITAESEEGVGSSFTLRLPYVVTAQAVTHDQEEIQSRHASVKQEFSGAVLVAEDTPELQLLEKRILESMGVTVTLANNGIEAVERARSNHYDLILMDMQMPEMDGIEATRTLRSRGNTIPIVPLTANVMQKHRDLYLELGCDEFLAKPIDKQELSVVLQKYLAPK